MLKKCTQKQASLSLTEVNIVPRIRDPCVVPRRHMGRGLGCPDHDPCTFCSFLRSRCREFCKHLFNSRQPCICSTLS